MDIGQYGKCLISLIKSAILDYDAEDLPKDTDIDTLIRLSKIHKVSNIIYPVLEKKVITSLE